MEEEIKKLYADIIKVCDGKSFTVAKAALLLARDFLVNREALIVEKDKENA